MKDSSMAVMWVGQTDALMAGYLAAHSAVYWVASMDETRAAKMDACWAGRKAASTDAIWVVY